MAMFNISSEIISLFESWQNVICMGISYCICMSLCGEWAMSVEHFNGIWCSFQVKQDYIHWTPFEDWFLWQILTVTQLTQIFKQIRILHHVRDGTDVWTYYHLDQSNWLNNNNLLFSNSMNTEYGYTDMDIWYTFGIAFTCNMHAFCE